jgi:hypothetical protein
MSSTIVLHYCLVHNVHPSANPCEECAIEEFKKSMENPTDPFNAPSEYTINGFVYVREDLTVRKY